MSDVTERITTYLINGGGFNPELADHSAVRNLLIDARAELDALRADLRDELERADAWHKMFLETQKHNDELRAERDLHNATKELFLRMKAELAAATARLENALNEGAKRRAERDALRAELAAERERNAGPSEYDLAVLAERDELRALLREAHPLLAAIAQFNKEKPRIYAHEGVRMSIVAYDVVSAISSTAAELSARFDAALQHRAEVLVVKVDGCIGGPQPKQKIEIKGGGDE